jgi:spore germination protein
MALQSLLHELGYLSVEPTGWFGPLTEAALKKLQSVNGLNQTGSVGIQTTKLLNQLQGL